MQYAVGCFGFDWASMRNYCVCIWNQLLSMNGLQLSTGQCSVSILDHIC